MKTIFQRKTSLVYCPQSGQAGLTLVELMISMAIGLFLISALTSLLMHQTATRDEFDKTSQQIENGRYALQILHDDIQLAGYYGQLFNVSAPGVGLIDPCAADLTSLGSAISLPIQGYDAAVSTPMSTLPCQSPTNYLPSANYLQGDILVIRRTDTSLTTLAAAAAGPVAEVYMQTTGSTQVLNTGNHTSAFTLTYNTTTNTGPADLRALLVHIYFISPCSRMANGSTCAASDDNGSPIPTLKRLELNSSGTFTLVPLVEGIQNMQLDYGIDADADGYPDSYITTPASTTTWSNVVAIRVNLLARNNNTSAGYSDSKTYTLGAAGSLGPFGDNYKRHVYSAVVRAVNLTGRRAQE